MVPAQLHSPAVDAILSTAAALLDMEVVFVGGLTEEQFTFARVQAHASWPGITEGLTVDRTDSMCHRMLSGAPQTTSDAAGDPAYREVPVRERLGIRSYVGVPVRNPAGEVVATLCGIDRDGVAVTEQTLAVLRGLADVLAAQLGPLAAEQVVIRRSPHGWEVAGEDMDDLTSAMVLADLLAADLEPPGRPPRGGEPLDELAQLTLSVRQLEHALAARVVVEQAIGVLTERQGCDPRSAFERLRKVARSGGRKVHDLAAEVVASATDHDVVLPPELTAQR